MTSSTADGDIWLAIQTKTSCVLQNWQSTRAYTPSLQTRTEGFTEHWGNGDDKENGESWNSETLISSIATTEPNIRLIQYRPAWLEQLALRVAKIDHVVVNSMYATTEATGPLPILQDIEKVTLINTCSPSTSSSLWEYLKKNYKVEFDSIIMDDMMQEKATLLETLIKDTLKTCWTVLRYCNLNQTWEQVYRTQCLVASGSHDQKWFSWLARWQAWSERIQALSNSLTPSQRYWSLEETLNRARKAYDLLEHQLGRIQKQHDLGSSNKTSKATSIPALTLLGTTKPVTVDLILFDHLMHALTDVHLVIVLADYPKLIQYVQHIWDRYFGGSASQSTLFAASDLHQFTNEQNAANVFNQFPLLLAHDKDDNLQPTITTAVDLMEQLSVQSNDLHEMLLLAKKTREEHGDVSTAIDYSSYLVNSAKRHIRSEPFSTWHRWRMGDSYYPSSKRTTRNTQEQGQQKASSEETIRRDYRRNDEIWMASVAVTTVAVILGFGLAGATGGNKKF